MGGHDLATGDKIQEKNEEKERKDPLCNSTHWRPKFRFIMTKEQSPIPKRPGYKPHRNYPTTRLNLLLQNPFLPD
jgi:hypothetical protein